MDHLSLCLNQDEKFSKILQIVNSPENAKALEKVLKTNYRAIKNIFLFYSSESVTYPTWSIVDFIMQMRSWGILEYPLDHDVVER